MEREGIPSEEGSLYWILHRTNSKRFISGQIRHSSVRSSAGNDSVKHLYVDDYIVFFEKGSSTVQEYASEVLKTFKDCFNHLN